MSILDRVKTPNDLKSLNYQEKKELASELRDVTIHTVSKTGGHLASNLGIVEMTIALHSVFNAPEDKIIWDVGHQTYIHKILTGRREDLSTLRQLDGIAGFPKTSESPYDSFNTGHSSTSISAALGMARARDIHNENYYIVAVIGDGALTGGMALEALNDAGCSNTNLIVVLNDNEMSIAKNVGGISNFLTRIRTKKSYNNSNKYIKKVVSKIPKLGPRIIRTVRKIKYSIKQMVIPNMLFEDFGFKYLGPVDGHNIENMEEILKKAKDLEGPILIHAITQKGKGYTPAETNPDKFHSISTFDVDTGESKKQKKLDYSAVFGKKLVDLAEKNENIVAITAAMRDGTGLKTFAEQFPNRFFDVGIAEQHALTMAAGMAENGLKPVVSIYSSFYQRAYDQVIHDICMQNLPVTMCIDRAGIVGNDGETHQGMFDLAFFNIVPNLTIMAPKDFQELEMMLESAISWNRPVAIRYPRGGEANIHFAKHDEIQLGKAEIIQENDSPDITIIALGKMVATALQVAEILKEKKYNCQVINARFLKPLDTETIKKSIQKSKYCATIEDGTIKGGLGSAIKELIIDEEIKDIKLKTFAYPDEFIRHGAPDELEKIYKMDANSIANIIQKENALSSIKE